MFKFIKRRRATFALALCFCLAVTLTACGDKEGQDTLKGIARNLHRVGNATARADELTHRLFVDGVISPASAEAISVALLDINKAARDFNTKARAYQSFDEKTKADVLKLAADTRDFINARINDGVAHIKDERARSNWRAIVNTSYDAFASIVLLIESAKPAPKSA